MVIILPLAVTVLWFNIYIRTGPQIYLHLYVLGKDAPTSIDFIISRMLENILPIAILLDMGLTMFVCKKYRFKIMTYLIICLLTVITVPLVVSCPIYSRFISNPYNNMSFDSVTWKKYCSYDDPEIHQRGFMIELRFDKKNKLVSAEVYQG